MAASEGSNTSSTQWRSANSVKNSEQQLEYRTEYDHVDLGQARFSEACLACVLHPLMQFQMKEGATPMGPSLRQSV